MSKDEKTAGEHNLAATVEHAKDKVQEQIHHALDQAKSTAQVAAGEAQTKVLGELQKGAQKVSGPVGEAADSLRGVANSLRDKEADDAAKVVDQAAERLMGIGDYLSSLGLDKTSEPPAKAKIPWWPFALVGAVMGVVFGLRWLKHFREAD